MTLRNLLADRLFLLGLGVRVAAILLVVPAVQTAWFVPFMRSAILAPSIDPWTVFVQGGGDPLSFPYGPVMLLFHALPVALGVALDALAGTDAMARVGFGVSLLIADCCLLLALMRIDKPEANWLVRYYWLSPIVLYVTYWHGQTDVIPTLFLVAALVALKEGRITASGLLLGLGASAKLSVVLAAPFLFLYLLKNQRYEKAYLRFAAAFLATGVLVQGVFFSSPGVQQMLLSNPELDKIYDLKVQLSLGTNLYIVPMAYLLLVYAAWRIGRINFDLLYAFVGLAFFLILLLTPASVGWYLWLVPFLAVYQLSGSRGGNFLVYVFCAALIFDRLLTSSGAVVPAFGLDASAPLAGLAPQLFNERLLSLALSSVTALGVMLAATLIRQALRDNDFFQISRSPLAIGIAGDSGTGKDTLAQALAGLFGARAVTTVSGDDYHKFDRRSAQWRALTHLDPRANDLRAYTNDALALIAGKPIVARRYDHRTGFFARARMIEPSDVVIVTGLHALYPAGLRAALDLKIFLAMDERLRRFFKLSRDSGERGHDTEDILRAIEMRKDDAQRYVNTQAAHADVVFALEPAVARPLGELSKGDSAPLRLRVRLSSSPSGEEVARLLVALCGARADYSEEASGVVTEFLIEGDEVAAENIQFAAQRLVPHWDELLAIKPLWQGGLTGIMQLFVLVHLADRVRSRRKPWYFA